MSQFDHDDDDEDECPGKEDCDDAYCEHRSTFFVEVTRTVKFAVRAHDEEEANEAADNVDIYVDELHNETVEDWNSDIDVTIESEADRYRAQAEHRRILAEIEAEMSASAS